MPFERIVESPEGVGDLYQQDTFICHAQYSMKVFQDFVPSDGAKSPFVPSNKAQRVEGEVTVPEGIQLQHKSSHNLRLPNKQRLVFQPWPGDVTGIYLVGAKDQSVPTAWS